MRQSQWAGEVETVLRRAVPPTDIARRSPSRPASFRLPRAFRSPLRLSVSPAKAGAQYACGCAATHAASARSAGPLRPTNKERCPPRMGFTAETHRTQSVAEAIFGTCSLTTPRFGRETRSAVSIYFPKRPVQTSPGGPAWSPATGQEPTNPPGVSHRVRDGGGCARSRRCRGPKTR